MPLSSTLVAIKAINLNQFKVEFDNIRCTTKTMSLLSHPNILNVHCSFIVGRRLLMVMPCMFGGSLQSIISSSFPEGLPERCITIVLKETLNPLSYLHNQVNLHRDIKVRNISNGCGALSLRILGGDSLAYDTGYIVSRSMWSFDITALELAHGRPPLSHLPPSKPSDRCGNNGGGADDIEEELG
ncbi:hypothetical protein V6N11_029530 [Hibiscus sabdariffa]|uniref:Protein kinase domain-containing protein n=1 Tax=Hibiscus sabdariffa TaxID=183260 RepID=A0ABR2P7E1_9ROSI